MKVERCVTHPSMIRTPFASYMQRNYHMCNCVSPCKWWVSADNHLHWFHCNSHTTRWVDCASRFHLPSRCSRSHLLSTDIINAGSQAKSLTGSFHKPYADPYQPIPSNSRILEKKTWHGQAWATLFWQDGHNFRDKKFHISGILIENTILYIHAPKSK